jgi:hypothetical protein
MNTLFSAQTTSPLMTANPLSSPSTQQQSLTSTQILQLGNASLENHLGSVLVLTEEGTVLYITESLQDRLQSLAHQNGQSDLPQEIALICQILRQCRGQFPHQNWAIEFDIFSKDAIALRIRSRWLKLEGFDQPCILLIVEDRQQMVYDIVLDEAQEWGLTPREQEVWLRHQEGYTYNQIADKLYISTNTVKKHMRSIYAKRRSQED